MLSVALLIAVQIAGQASVIDGDTLDIHGDRIRIWGIDAPEARQTCERNGETYRCGQAAALALADWIGDSPTICQQQGRDRYGRTVATCTARGSDVGRWMIRSGWAIEYTQYSDGRYRADQDAATSERAGMHAGEFTPPAAWRRAQRSSTATPAPSPSPAPIVREDCPIKGNINREGERIYHLPGMRSYTGTRIDTEAGERWFCSEEEALAAGWRAPHG